MPRRVSEVGEGTDDSNGVYGLIRDLLVEGKDARFVNRRGRYVLNWSRALDCYADYKARKNPHFKSKNLTRRKASNGLRSALLNFYKKEGAKEYKESKKVNDKDEVVERQFQMPSRVFESLFGNTVPSGESEQEDEQEINSIISEGEIDAEATPNSSDHGFDETMDLSCCDLSGSADPDSLTSPNDLLTSPNVDGFKTEEDVSIVSPDAAFHAQMFDTSAVDSALDEIICSDGISDEISEDMDLLGVLQDICPTSGSVKGGYRFYISLTEPLSEEVSSGDAEFDGVSTVPVHKLNPFTLSGSVPSSDQPGDVPVTVTTQSGQRLGMTCFQYVDDMREVARQLVHDPAKQALWFAILCQEYGFFGTDSDVVQVLDPLNIEYQDPSNETKQQQSVKVLQLLVYAAAQTNAKQFIEMIFSTSAGRIVFDSYKDRTQLPEDVARANGHNECAQYLQDLTKRLSKETECEDQPKKINWLELVKAVQNETSVSSGNENKRPGSSVENDDNTSDYFADAETSSLGSMEPDDVCPSDSEEEDAANKGLKSAFGFSKPFSDDTSSNGRFHIGSASIHIPGFWPTTLNTDRCHKGPDKGPECYQDNSIISSGRRYSGRELFIGILLAGALLVLVAWFMLGGPPTASWEADVCVRNSFRSVLFCSKSGGVRNVTRKRPNENVLSKDQFEVGINYSQVARISRLRLKAMNEAKPMIWKIGLVKYISLSCVPCPSEVSEQNHLNVNTSYGLPCLSTENLIRVAPPNVCEDICDMVFVELVNCCVNAHKEMPLLVEAKNEGNNSFPISVKIVIYVSDYLPAPKKSSPIDKILLRLGRGSSVSCVTYQGSPPGVIEQQRFDVSTGYDVSSAVEVIMFIPGASCDRVVIDSFITLLTTRKRYQPLEYCAKGRHGFMCIGKTMDENHDSTHLLSNRFINTLINDKESGKEKRMFVFILSVLVGCGLLIIILIIISIIISLTRSFRTWSCCHVGEKSSHQLISCQRQDFSVADVCVSEPYLCFAKLPQEDASMKELQMESVRSGFCDSEAFVSTPFADATDTSAITGKPHCLWDRLLRVLSRELVSSKFSEGKWKELGLALGLQPSEIGAIQQEHVRRSERCYQMLLSWKQISGHRATQEALKAGLCSVNLIDLAEKYCFFQDVQVIRCCDG